MFVLWGGLMGSRFSRGQLGALRGAFRPLLGGSWVVKLYRGDKQGSYN